MLIIMMMNFGGCIALKLLYEKNTGRISDLSDTESLAASLAGGPYSGEEENGDSCLFHKDKEKIN